MKKELREMGKYVPNLVHIFRTIAQSLFMYVYYSEANHPKQSIAERILNTGMESWKGHSLTSRKSV
jgi:hypothetical protein